MSEYIPLLEDPDLALMAAASVQMIADIGKSNTVNLFLRIAKLIEESDIADFDGTQISEMT